MDLFKQVFEDKISAGEISEAYVKVIEYTFWHENNKINTSQKLSINIYQNLNGQFLYTLSHHYKKSSNAIPYRSSVETKGYDTIEEALKKAKSQLFLHYSENDTEAEWVKSPIFNLSIDATIQTSVPE